MQCSDDIKKTFPFCFQLLNLSERRHDITRLNPKVGLPVILQVKNSLQKRSFNLLLPSPPTIRSTTLAGPTSTPHRWIRSVPYARPWRTGWTLTPSTWWSYTARSDFRGPLRFLRRTSHHFPGFKTGTCDVSVMTDVSKQACKISGLTDACWEWRLAHVIWPNRSATVAQIVKRFTADPVRHVLE